jgi:predicted kinase
MIILVAGLPGSGKSYFAERLSDKLDAVYINSDQVRAALQATGKYSFNDKLLVYKEMMLQATQAMERKRDVIVDATFYHHTMREMFLRLAAGYNVDVRVIEITADEGLIRQRLQKPRKYSEADYRVYEIVRDDFEGITMPHLTLQSTDNNLDEMLKQAKRYIESEGE